MIRIGDFSKFSRVPVKTLRYYNEIGLLKPVKVDRFSGYRYYEFGQLQRLHRILALKDLGFSLEEIGRLLEGDLSVEQMRAMWKLRQAEIRQRMQEQAQRLERVERWLNQIEQEDSMAKYDVVLKKVEAMKVASVRGVVPTPPDQGVLWGELLAFLEKTKVPMSGSPAAIYHDPESKERDWDIEVSMPIAEAVAPAGRVKVYDLPGAEMACAVHAGPFATIDQAYNALAKRVSENGYRIAGPSREINVRLPARPGDQNDPATINEIQFPVTKG